MPDGDIRSGVNAEVPPTADHDAGAMVGNRGAGSDDAERGGPPTHHIDAGLTRVVDRLQESLSRGDVPQAFSDLSLARLLERQAEYVEEVGLEAVRLARRAQTDVVSASDIEAADNIIRSGAGRRRNRYVDVFGGVLFGGGVGQLIEAFSTEPLSERGVLVGVVMSLIGLALVMYALVRE